MSDPRKKSVATTVWGLLVLGAAIALLVWYLPSSAPAVFFGGLLIALVILSRRGRRPPSGSHAVDLAPPPASQEGPEGESGAHAPDGGDQPDATPPGKVTLRCLACGNTEFTSRYAQLNTAVATFFNLDWANRSARCEICTRCGYIHWFHEWEGRDTLQVKESDQAETSRP
jgi:predicted nucleic-acid-binding Zn-ribbon protein